MNEATGFAHFMAQSDFVGKSLFLFLMLMSAVSWYYIITKQYFTVFNQKTQPEVHGFFLECDII